MSESTTTTQPAGLTDRKLIELLKPHNGFDAGTLVRATGRQLREAGLKLHEDWKPKGTYAAGSDNPKVPLLFGAWDAAGSSQEGKGQKADPGS